LEETLRGLEDLVRAGKVLYLGASNYAAWQVAKGLGISERRGWARFEVLQPMYNLVKRQVEVEILPLARAEGLGAITCSPVGGGQPGRDGPDHRRAQPGAAPPVAGGAVGADDAGAARPDLRPVAHPASGHRPPRRGKLSGRAWQTTAGCSRRSDAPPPGQLRF